MALQLSAVLTAIRDRHPAFYKTRVPDAVLARFLTDYQNELIAKGTERQAGYLAQSVAVVVSLDAANAPGTVGAGTAGGLPGSVDGNGQISLAETTGGALIELLETAAAGGHIVVGDRVVSAATATTISSTGAGRTTNQDALRVVLITDGKGAGQVREVLSNTSAQWVISTGSDGKQWTTTPDTTSIFSILEAQLDADGAVSVVTGVPLETSRSGYLVRLNAQGTPYIDYTKILTASIDAGIALPSMVAPLGGTVRFIDGDADPLCITSYARRYQPPATPAVYCQGETLFLCGVQEDWLDVRSIELQYVPVAPAFTAVAEYFLLPDAARGVLVAKGAGFAALRIHGVEPDIDIDAAAYAAVAAEAEGRYLSSLRLTKRTRHTTIREVGY